MITVLMGARWDPCEFAAVFAVCVIAFLALRRPA